MLHLLENDVICLVLGLLVWVTAVESDQKTPTQKSAVRVGGVLSPAQILMIDFEVPHIYIYNTYSTPVDRTSTSISTK